MTLKAQEIAKLVGFQLRTARQNQKMGIRTAAKRIGISPGYLSMLEQGKRNTSIYLLFRASSVYRVKVDVLLGREMLGEDRQIQRIADKMQECFLYEEPTKR